MEFETKFRIEDKTLLEKKLQNFELLGIVDKEDSYYILQNKKFRIRKSNKKYIATIKNKRVKDGFESNVEYEFSLAGDFENFFMLLGAKLHYKKQKKGYVYQVEDALLEIFDLYSDSIFLGSFLEIEIVEDESKMEFCKTKIESLATKLGIKHKEMRSYEEIIISAFLGK